MKTYDVVINGIAGRVQLSDQDAEAFGLTAGVEGPAQPGKAKSRRAAAVAEAFCPGGD